MWLMRCKELDAGHGIGCTFDVDSRPATLADALRGWAEDREFRAFFCGVLAKARFAAYRWEMPPVTASTVTR